MINKMFVVSNPIGMPMYKQFIRCSCAIDKSPLSMANAVPKVMSGPKARNIVSSPRPLLATSLSGGAV